MWECKESERNVNERKGERAKKGGQLWMSLM